MHDAEKREKVISALEKRYDPERDNLHLVIIPNGLVQDALALLKEQEPRVMTLEEVRDSDDWMWIEYLSGYVEWQKQSDIYGYYEDGVMWNDSTFDGNDSYGIEWRCWTSRPSPEQMRETKWEGDSDA